jgi:hypothetical protein
MPTIPINIILLHSSNQPTTHFPLAQGSTHVHASAMRVGLSPSEHVLQLACPASLWYFNGPADTQEEHAAWPGLSLYSPTAQALQLALPAPE